MKHRILQILLLSFFTQIFGQEVPYFNNIYQHNNNFASGRTIIQTEVGYVGYGATEDPSNIGQMLVFFKINNGGSELIWKPFGENYYVYYPGNVGGAMIETYDNSFVLACTYDYNYTSAYTSLIKLDNNLDTIWKKNYNFQYYTVGVNCTETADSGFIIPGWVADVSSYTDFFLLKTDKNGNYQWHNTYGGNLADHAQQVIETPDGGFLVGGLSWNPPVYHSMDAVVFKTDSLGNEEWTKYFGNPYVDDDMALVAMADDGNYLVATVYGEYAYSSDYHIGRPWLIKLNSEGQIIDQMQIGDKRLAINIKNFRKTDDGYIMNGFSYQTDTATFQYYSGWMLKIDNNLDSIWFRDYIHGDETWDNFFYDAYPTSDNGYIAIGKARPDDPGATNKMWIVKVDSMGCDTPGCATGVQVFDIPADDRQELLVWPNPAKGKFSVQCAEFRVSSPQIIRVYNSQGVNVEEVEVPKTKESISINCMDWQKGLYLIQLVAEGTNIKTAKVIVH